MRRLESRQASRSRLVTHSASFIDVPLCLRRRRGAFIAIARHISPNHYYPFKELIRAGWLRDNIAAG